MDLMEKINKISNISREKMIEDFKNDLDTQNSNKLDWRTLLQLALKRENCKPFECKIKEDIFNFYFGFVNGESDKTIPATLGGTSSHMYIGGNTGQGKSNLLRTAMVVTHYLYSPLEVQITYVDFKIMDGASYVTPVFSPLCNSVCLSKDGVYMETLIDGIRKEMEERQNFYSTLKFKDGSQIINFVDYRKYINEEHPEFLKEEKYRKYYCLRVIILDELQDYFKQQDAEYASKFKGSISSILGKGRATGFRMILCSQGAEDTLDDYSFNQILVRFCLNSNANVSKQILKNDTAYTTLKRYEGILTNNVLESAEDYNKQYKMLMPLISANEILKAIKQSKMFLFYNPNYDIHTSKSFYSESEDNRVCFKTEEKNNNIYLSLEECFDKFSNTVFDDTKNKELYDFKNNEYFILGAKGYYNQDNIPFMAKMNQQKSNTLVVCKNTSNLYNLCWILASNLKRKEWANDVWFCIKDDNLLKSYDYKSLDLKILGVKLKEDNVEKEFFEKYIKFNIEQRKKFLESKELILNEKNQFYSDNNLDKNSKEYIEKEKDILEREKEISELANFKYNYYFIIQPENMNNFCDFSILNDYISVIDKHPEYKIRFVFLCSEIGKLYKIVDFCNYRIFGNVDIEDNDYFGDREFKPSALNDNSVLYIDKNFNKAVRRLMFYKLTMNDEESLMF